MNFVISLGSAAEGSIEPQFEQHEKTPEVKHRIANGDFLRNVDHQIICGCIDGRCGGQLRVSSAGGTISLMVMDDLTTKRFAGEDGSTRQALANVVGHLQSSGYEVGGHTDDHAAEEKTGCGANDKLPTIYSMMVSKADVIREVAEKILGKSIDDSIHKSIIRQAFARGSFSPSTDLRDVLNQADQTKPPLDELRGKHREVVILVNTRHGATLDHQALEDEYGPDYEAFCVDAWAFDASARALAEDSTDELEIEEKIVALTYYNLATALTLCGPKMEVVTAQ